MALKPQYITIRNVWIIVAAVVCVSARGEMRTWTSSASGQTIEGEYVSYLFENVVIRNAAGKEIKVPFDSLVEDDRKYVELHTPPKLKVEYRESAQSKEYTGPPWQANNGFDGPTFPIHIAPARFGAEVFQTSSQSYRHDLVLEMVVLTKQRLDQDKYHIIAHIKSKPFKLTKENDRQFEFEDTASYNILYFDLFNVFPRGEKLGEFIILVWDERGEIVGYNSSKKWLYSNVDKLLELPTGAWINDECVRVHPTSPPQVNDTSDGW